MAERQRLESDRRTSRVVGVRITPAICRERLGSRAPPMGGRRPGRRRGESAHTEAACLRPTRGNPRGRREEDPDPRPEPEPYRHPSEADAARANEHKGDHSPSPRTDGASQPELGLEGEHPQPDQRECSAAGQGQGRPTYERDPAGEPLERSELVRCQLRFREPSSRTREHRARDESAATEVASIGAAPRGRINKSTPGPDAVRRWRTPRTLAAGCRPDLVPGHRSRFPPRYATFERHHRGESCGRSPLPAGNAESQDSG